MHIFYIVKQFILDILFPITCVGCGGEGFYLCEPCVQGLRQLLPACIGCNRLVPALKNLPPGRTCSSCARNFPIYAHYAPFAYENGPIRELLHQMKYGRVSAAADTCASLLFSYLRRHKIVFPEDVLLVPIPLSKGRERTRGFNQSERIARAFGEKTGIEVCEALKKIKDTLPQTELSGSDRMVNVKGVFDAAFGAIAVVGRVCILVDDVKTTGATLAEAARVLKAAGAKRVWAITVAR